MNIGLHEVEVGAVLQEPVRAGEPWAFRGVWRGRPVMVWLAEGPASVDPRLRATARGGRTDAPAPRPSTLMDACEVRELGLHSLWWPG